MPTCSSALSGDCDEACPYRPTLPDLTHPPPALTATDPRARRRRDSASGGSAGAVIRLVQVEHGEHDRGRQLLVHPADVLPEVGPAVLIESGCRPTCLAAARRLRGHARPSRAAHGQPVRPAACRRRAAPDQRAATGRPAHRYLDLSLTLDLLASFVHYRARAGPEGGEPTRARGLSDGSRHHGVRPAGRRRRR